MNTTYSVAISFGSDLGWIDFDEQAHEIEVHIANEQAKKTVEEYLGREHTIQVPHQTLMDFTEETFDPKADLRSFQTVLTRLWGETGIQVDWSRPVDYVKAHPHY